MTQMWKGEEVVAVTKVTAGPCPVVRVKEKGRDGYVAVQIGYGEKKASKMKKPQKGHLQKLSVDPTLRYLREFRTDKYREQPQDGLKTGDIIDVNVFASGDIIDVTGTSKGKGFQGVVKRHGFSGSKKTHGNKDQERMSGSIGSKGPARVFKGVRMGGQMGSRRVTEKNLEIFDIDAENNIIYIKGQVPGARGSLVMISGKGELKLKAAVPAEIEAPATPVETVSESAEKNEPETGDGEQPQNEEIKKE